MIEVLCDPEDLVEPCELRRVRSDLDAILPLIERDEKRTVDHVTVLLVTTARIIELHSQFFEDPTPTDVITFPAEDESDSALISGDIAICAEVAREQANDANCDFVSEIVFLAVHGLLHLAGWDDNTPLKRSKMIARQQALMYDAGAGSGTRK